MMASNNTGSIKVNAAAGATRTTGKVETGTITVLAKDTTRIEGKADSGTITVTAGKKHLRYTIDGKLWYARIGVNRNGSVTWLSPENPVSATPAPTPTPTPTPAVTQPRLTMEP